MMLLFLFVSITRPSVMNQIVIRPLLQVDTVAVVPHTGTTGCTCRSKRYLLSFTVFHFSRSLKSLISSEVRFRFVSTNQTPQRPGPGPEHQGSITPSVTPSGRRTFLPLALPRLPPPPLFSSSPTFLPPPHVSLSPHLCPIRLLLLLLLFLSAPSPPPLRCRGDRRDHG